MKRQNIVLAVIGGIAIAALALATGYLVSKNLRQNNLPPAVCTDDLQACPDGSFVGRIGNDCRFDTCPSVLPVPSPVPMPGPIPAPSGLGCTQDSDCPSSAYICQAIEGYGTVTPDSTEQSSTFTITRGECKLKTGNECAISDDCRAGLVCHENICTEPVDGECSGLNDTSCQAGYRCIQDCGAPVVREGDPEPGYHCVVEEVASQPRNCPICLASNVLIDTPDGEVLVTQLRQGMTVWSQNEAGEKVAAKIINFSKLPSPSTHKVVHFILSDLRQVWLSPDHPLTDGRSAGQLTVGDAYGGSFIEIFELVPYWDKYTYDLLPATATGYYWANGILLGSTLK